MTFEEIFKRYKKDCFKRLSWDEYKDTKEAKKSSEFKVELKEG